jgi:ligand-binding sensor domain-containing protein/signal transduction histidine kinase
VSSVVAGRRLMQSSAAVVLCLVLLGGRPLHASRGGLFDAWTTENGLPQNSVNDILQTRDGYLWLATHGGLVRFDGVRFTVFDRSTPGIASQRIRALHEDRRGALWAGTEDGVVIRYADRVFTSYTNADGLPHDVVVRIEDGADGALWVTWHRGRVMRFDDGRFVPFDPRELPHAIHRPPDSHYLDLWTRVEPDAVSVFVGGALRRIPLSAVLSGHRVTGVNSDRQRNIWIRTSGAGVVRVTDEEISRLTTADGLPTDSPDGMFYGGPDGAVWFCDRLTTNVYRIVNGSAELISRTGIRAFYAGRDGSTWIGTVANGLHRLRTRAFTVYGDADGLSGNWVYPILQDGRGTIWIGTGNGLNTYAAGRFSRYRGALPSDNITCLYEDRTGRLWVATTNGVGVLRNGRFEPYTQAGALLAGPIGAIHHDREGAYWFATEAGLVRARSETIVRYTSANGLSHDRVTALFEDRDAALWIGTHNGITRLKDGVFTRFAEAEGFSGSGVRAFHQDDDGVLWVGTTDGGLYRLADARLTRYTRRDGLHDNGIFQILEDHRGHLWMGSNRGIVRVSRADLNEFARGRRGSIATTVFGTSDGLVSLEVNGGRQPPGLKTADGRLWFPTMAGIAIVDPAAVPDDPRPPVAVIEEVRVAGRPVQAAQVVSVPAGSSALDVEYTAASFIRPGQVRFRYRLVGLDADWVEAGDRRAASFQRLPPGRYDFVVAASHRSGVWGPEARVAGIVVLPPFWRTWWFMSIAAATLAAAAIAAHEHRMRRLRVEHARQLAFSRQLLDSQERERRRISNEMHDSLGQHATIIRKRTQAAAGHIRDRARVMAELDEIAAIADQIKVEMKEIAQDLRPYHLDRIGLSRTMEKMAHKTGEACNLQVSTDIAPIDDLVPDGSRIHIYRIFQESLHNVVKHANATRMTVAVSRSNGAVRIVIEDNGQGLVAANGGAKGTSMGFGLMGIKERARILGGVVEFRAGDAGGTATILTLPLEGANGG